MSLVPTSGKAEFHLTYACDLECSACNRASFLREPHTPSMTIEDGVEFFRQAKALGWRPRVTLVGGEPTMHPQFQDFVDLARENTDEAPQVFSNGTQAKTQRLLQIARDRGASVAAETQKPNGTIHGPADYEGWELDVFVSPEDHGYPLRPPCYQHASVICGVSVDHEGYAPCAMGGAIEALLHVGGRTKVLADLFDEEKVAKMTADLCRHCGHQYIKASGGAFQRQVDESPRLFDSPMSPTWRKAFEGRR